MQRLAITGRMRAGKDVVARHLTEQHGYVDIAFSSAMKRLFHDLCPWVAAEPKPRAEYQRFGEEMRRMYGADIWIRHVERAVANLERYYEANDISARIVVTDLRLPAEYEWARANGFKIIRVNANEDTRLKRARRAGDDFNEKDFEHDTEMYVDEFEVDYEIDNDGDLAELERKVNEIMREITKGAD